MRLNRDAIDDELRSLIDIGLINEAERSEILFVLEPGFPFSPALDVTESIHAHVKVPDTALAPHERLRDRGYRVENSRPGYVKHGSGAGLNVILSSIPIAVDDQIPGAVTLRKPFVDHVGVDIRDETAPSQAAFDVLPGRAAALGWNVITQVGPVQCHTNVKVKHWVYPPTGGSRCRRPIEFALGRLRVLTDEVGCDLRPIDPDHPLASPPSSCCGSVVGDSRAAAAALRWELM